MIYIAQSSLISFFTKIGPSGVPHVAGRRTLFVYSTIVLFIYPKWHTL